MKKNKKTIIAVIVITILLAIFSESDDKKTDNQISKKASTESKYIKGLMPVDVYMNFENRGFTKKEQFDSEYGNTWINTLNESGVKYTVETFSDNATDVINVRGTAITNENKNIVATKPFFKYLCSLPFDENDPKKMAEWIDNNFNKNNASIKVGGVNITISSTSLYTKVITIEKYTKTN